MDSQQPARSRNEVTLIGRLGSRVSERELPSGDRIVVFSVVVDRPARAVRGTVRVDTIACQATRTRVAERIARLEPGTLVRVEGALRRRFWRTGSALASAMEVDAASVSIVR